MVRCRSKAASALECKHGEIAPKLDGFSLKEIGKAKGLSFAACSRIRAGAKAPHPRHWEALLTLIKA